VKTATFRFLLVATFSLASLTSPAAPPSTDQPRRLRLLDTPITLYPETNLAGSGLAGFFNAQARPHDAIVVSYVDALKVPARLSSLGIERGEIWVYVPADLDLTQAGRRNLEGAKGIVFVPASRIDNTRFNATARRISESAATLGCRMIAGLEQSQTRSLSNIADVARHASVLTIYDGQRLRSGGEEYRRYVERLAHEARAVNPSIQIDVCISTGGDAAATKALAGVLWNCADLADRIGIYCNDSAESRASLAVLYQVLRGAPHA
jgi:hypothetical protein